MAREFRIFYSWQSDLPGNETRNFINDSIDAAVKFLAGTVVVIPDRDTKYETGSPNIEQIIFEKIDDSDLFIADLSIVGEYETKSGEKKYTPNPNVLLELGYAVKKLGWERVICFINTDYGEVNRLPFDLNHHRVSGYSLRGKEKADVRKNLRDIISSTVMSCMESGLSPKKGFASHVVGSYNWSERIVEEKLVPIEIFDSPDVKNIRTQILEKAKEKYESAKAIQLCRLPNKSEADNNTSQDFITINEQKYSNPIKKIDIFEFRSVKIKDDEIDYLKKSIESRFSEEVTDDFFDLGNLEVSANRNLGIGVEYRGDEDAERKYRLINSCMGYLLELDLFERYINMFKDVRFFPLAIWNNTTITDKDINVAVTVMGNGIEVLAPDENLIADDLRDAAGEICEKQYIEQLFSLPHDSNIEDGSDYYMKYSALFAERQSLVYTDVFGREHEPSFDIDDYVDTLQLHIANPIDSSNREFIFHVNKLRPNEKNWIGKGILIRTNGNEIKMKYKVTSEFSDGNVEGEIVFDNK